MRTKKYRIRPKIFDNLGLGACYLTVQHAVHPSPSVRAADCLPLWGDTAARPPFLGRPALHAVAEHLRKVFLELQRPVDWLPCFVAYEKVTSVSLTHQDG